MHESVEARAVGGEHDLAPVAADDFAAGGVEVLRPCGRRLGEAQLGSRELFGHPLGLVAELRFAFVERLSGVADRDLGLLEERTQFDRAFVLGDGRLIDARASIAISRLAIAAAIALRGAVALWRAITLRAAVARATAGVGRRALSGAGRAMCAGCAAGRAGRRAGGCVAAVAAAGALAVRALATRIASPRLAAIGALGRRLLWWRGLVAGLLAAVLAAAAATTTTRPPSCLFVHGR